MKRFKKAVGIIIVTAVMTGLFIFTAQGGLTEAVKAWGSGIVLTAMIVCGVYLAFDD